MTDYLIKEVFKEFQDNLNKLLDKHDEVLLKQEEKIQKLQMGQLKILLASSFTGAGIVKGLEKLLEILK